MTLRPSSPRARRKWLGLFGVVMFLLTLVGGAVLAVHDVGEFELDKNASNNTNITKLGDLAANISSTATTLNICRTAAATPAPDFTIQIRAERMTVTNVANSNFGGNCGGTKQTFTVTRGVGTVAAAQAKGGVDGIISLVVTATKDGPDWNDVHQSVTADGNNTGDDDKCIGVGDLVECAFISDQIGPSTFIGGASKDHLPIEGWMSTSGASPDKAEILNAYAAKAIDENGDQLLYFGMDRYAVDGSTDIGFWFFRGPVTNDPVTGAFTGTHQGDIEEGDGDDDILVLATFTQGGAATNIRVFRWVGTGGNESGTIAGPDADAGDCIQNPPLTDDELCGTVNDTTIPVPWTYTFKGAPSSGWIPAGGMFEGGINLTDLGLDGCFSSFLAETRSSPEITAILKDFALGDFEACGTELTTTPKTGAGGALTADTDSDNLDEISIGTGSVSVKDSALLNVTGTTSFTGTLKFFICGPITTGTCTTGGVAAGSQTVTANGTYTSDAVSLTSVGRYCWRGEFDSGTQGVPDAVDTRAESAGPPKSTGECFEVTPVTPTLSTTATTAVAIGAAIGDTATLAGTANQPGTNGGTTPGVSGSQYPSINATNGAAAGGSITFNLYGPNDATCTGTVIYTATRTVSGNDTYPTASQAAVSFTPTAAGTYRWVASYNGSTPNTNSKSGACNDANETSVVVDAYITISPDEDTNEVGDDHTFTVNVYQDDGLVAGASGGDAVTGFGPAPDGTTVTVSLTDANGASSSASSDTCATGTTAGACEVTISSASAGKVTADASVTFSVGGVSLTRSTDGEGNNSDVAVKFFVDAYITISPDEDTNEVNDDHTFTVNVYQDDGREAADLDGDGVDGFGPAPDGTTVTVSLTDANGASSSASSDTCATGTTAGACEVTISSASAGKVTADASVTFSVGGVSLTRSTDGEGNNSDVAVKFFVDAYITISPDEDTNEVNDDHTFTVNVYQDDGREAADLDGDGVDGFGPAPDGTTVTVSLTDANGASSSASSDTCATGTTAGACEVTISSASAGKVTADASVTFSVGGVSLTRSTDGEGNNSDVAVKFFVDAYITINPPTATNTVGDDHTFTVNVYQDDGREAADLDGDGVDGFGPAPDGTIVLVSLTDTEGAAHTTSADTCADPGTDAGACEVTFTSPTAGLVTGHATVTFDVGGVSLFRETDDIAPNSGDAEKRFVAGSISWTKVDNAGDLQGGATFELCRTHDYDIENVAFVDIDPDECIDVVDDVGDAGYVGNDENDAPGEFLVSGLRLGRYTVTETVAPPGFEVDPDTVTVDLTPNTEAEPDNTEQVIDEAFVNSRPILKITGFGYTNVPVGDQPHGILKGTTTYSVELHNYGTAEATLTNSMLVVSDNATCEDGNALLIETTIAVGADSGPFTLTCTYDSPDPAEIEAVLTIKYTTNGLERTASGSPATIIFTVAGD